MSWKDQWKKLVVIAAVFAGFYFLPIETDRFKNAIIESVGLVKWYAREHVLLCLVPAFFIAGAISVFINKESVMRYLGPAANKVVAYGVASVSGCILAVCSCTVLPLFAGIYRMGAGLGPATAFLYSGPAINVLAIILTARILGFELGTARAVCAIVFSIVIGLLMHFIFRKEELEKAGNAVMFSDEKPKRNLLQNAIYFASMVGILIFVNWARPESEEGLWYLIYSFKWAIGAGFAIILGLILCVWFGMKWWKFAVVAASVLIVSVIFRNPQLSFVVGVILFSVFISLDKNEQGQWFWETWGFTKRILPLLFAGVLIAGLLLGRVGNEGLIPSKWVAGLVGGNSVWANLFASVFGAFMYFATLTEIPILQGLIGAGMGKGPALALLLAGPALSLPNMLVIRSVIGTVKTLVFVLLVIVMSTISGMIFGGLF
jgi:uncharacterized protein